MTETDSFENIIDDARSLGSCTYACSRRRGPVNRNTCRGCMFGDPVTCCEEMNHDLVRRCKDVAFGIRFERGDIAGSSVKIGEVATFPDAKADKAQALKVLEEAAEVFGALQAGYDHDHPNPSRWPILDECVDVIQAVCNLVAAYGVTDFAPYMDMCKRRNEERGRL